MELKVDMPSLAGQDIDPETFQRVWNRVMPGQSAPAAIPDTAVLAEPTLPPVPDCLAEPITPPVPECPAEPAAPPVPECPAEPTIPPVPECPAEPAVPPVPECPTRPQCSCSCRPVRPNRPRELEVDPAPSEEPILCLGEASQEDSGQLEELMTLARTGAVTSQALSRRAGGSRAKTLAALTRDHRSAFRRLSAAYFLITGKRFSPQCSAVTLPASLPLALRQQFVWEQQWEQRSRQAAQATADPCLKELYLELAQEGALHAGCIRSMLEQMA
ncbi:hypothetical protein D1641_00190 [Colidextribacter sp. OB.20]|uniref:hypothetical protein n=1 Tax=Colidextribacter sp. OB.20 TaxID=2304568 RepID=UPI001367FF3B|nr:hypothetical protein [Colidextribacter sp. OB.20]NBI08440.1 hypothetical protein [Colidextribacter sp. OB.20]